MENTLLVGLSRQVTLERQMDVVANNVANASTNGFKADRSLFAEYLMPTAREDNFAAGRDRKLSHVIDRATFRDYGQGSLDQTKNPLDVAIDGDAFLVVQTPRGERYTRNGALQINATGALVTSEGYQVLGDGGPLAGLGLDVRAHRNVRRVADHQVNRTVEFAECIGACEGAPAVLVNDEHVLDVTNERADELIAKLRSN